MLMQDDERALLEELNRIKAEREVERRKKEAEEAAAAQSKKQLEVAAGNPLLYNSADFGVNACEQCIRKHDRCHGAHVHLDTGVSSRDCQPCACALRIRNAWDGSACVHHPA